MMMLPYFAKHEEMYLQVDYFLTEVKSLRRFLSQSSKRMEGIESNFRGLQEGIRTRFSTSQPEEREESEDDRECEGGSYVFLTQDEQDERRSQGLAHVKEALLEVCGLSAIQERTETTFTLSRKSSFCISLNHKTPSDQVILEQTTAFPEFMSKCDDMRGGESDLNIERREQKGILEKETRDDIPVRSGSTQDEEPNSQMMESSLEADSTKQCKIPVKEDKTHKRIAGKKRRKEVSTQSAKRAEKCESKSGDIKGSKNAIENTTRDVIPKGPPRILRPRNVYCISYRESPGHEEKDDKRKTRRKEKTDAASKGQREK